MKKKNGWALRNQQELIYLRIFVTIFLVVVLYTQFDLFKQAAAQMPDVFGLVVWVVAIIFVVQEGLPRRKA